MSEVAGRMATQVGARFLEKPQGGKGKTDGWRERAYVPHAYLSWAVVSWAPMPHK